MQVDSHEDQGPQVETSQARDLSDTADKKLLTTKRSVKFLRAATIAGGAVAVGGGAVVLAPLLGPAALAALPFVGHNALLALAATPILPGAIAAKGVAETAGLVGSGVSVTSAVAERTIMHKAVVPQPAQSKR